MPFVELAYNIKVKLGLPLMRSNDISWKQRTDEFFAPAYVFVNEGTETNYNLIRNKADSGWLASELKNVDVFLIETNFNGVFQLSTNKIVKSKLVQFCFEVDITTLKKASQQRLDIN